MSGSHGGTSPGEKAPKQIGDFELVAKLGQGAMGSVFKARQRMLDRMVALKVLLPSIAKDEDFIGRFVREARASAKLSHPNIVAGIDVGQDEETKLWYFAMEFVDGPTVKQMQEREAKIPEDKALEIVRDIAHALDCAHQAGMVHRDVKPDNILVTSDGTAKLADLGLARQMSEDSSLTQSGQALGTPYYMAPEQARGENETLDTRADLYALGATLFHMVTGVTPFTGETAAVIMAKHLTEPPPVAHRVNPDVSQGCSRLILRLMQKDKAKRLQTPRQVADQIERLLKLPADARVGTTGSQRAVRDTTGPRNRVRATTAAQDVVHGRRSRDSREVDAVGDQKKSLPLILGGVVGLVAVVVIGLFVFGGNDETRQAARKEAQDKPKILPPLPTPKVPPKKKAASVKPVKKKDPVARKVAAATTKKAAPVKKPIVVPAPKKLPPPVEAATGWRSLFDGKSLNGWQGVKIPPPLFGKGVTGIEDGMILLDRGGPVSGLRYLGEVPKVDYEIECEAMRVSGPDAFCLLKLPVEGTSVVLVLGGFGNSIVGLDQVDGRRANDNLATKRMSFRNNHWYRVHVQITKTHISATIDGEQVLNLSHKQHRLSADPAFAAFGPLAMGSWDCRTLVRSIRIRGADTEIAKPAAKADVPPPVAGIKATIYWLMADDMDIYHNGKPLRVYQPSFRTRRDEARMKQAFSARITLRPGDVFTVGGRRGGSYGGTVVVVDEEGQPIWWSNTKDWFVYNPVDKVKWYLPEVAKRSKQWPTRVARSFGFQMAMKRKYGDKPQPIWDRPSQRFCFMVGFYGKAVAAPPPEEAGGISEKATVAYKALLQETTPLLKKNRFEEAVALLKKKAANPDLKEMADLVKQEQADVNAVAALRNAAIESLRGQNGKTIKMRIGKRVESGKVQTDPKRKGVTLNVDGLVMTIHPEQIHVEDIDRSLPKAQKAEDLRLRGVMFLFAGETDKAKDYLDKAKKAGATKGKLQPYLERIASAGEMEDRKKPGGNAKHSAKVALPQGAIMHMSLDKDSFQQQGEKWHVKNRVGQDEKAIAGWMTVPPKFAEGLRNEACQFDGVKDVISTKGDEMSASQAAGTLSIWVRSADPMAVRSIFHTEECRDRLIWTEAGKFKASMYTGFKFEIVDGGRADTDWHHLVFSWDINKGILLFYVDEKLVDKREGRSWTTTARDHTTVFGGRRTADKNVPARIPFQGLLDEIVLWDRVLTAEEVKALHNSYRR